MVLEHLFPDNWLERKGQYAFLLGICYAALGILGARLIFPSDPALVSVAFISLLLLPSLRKLFALGERREMREKKFTLLELYKDNRNFVRTYLSLFLGILFTYAVLTMILDNFSANQLFRAQLEIHGNYGGAVMGQQSSLFWSLLKNNFIVLLACFFLSLLAGDGAIFFITWNASVWGTIFGHMAKTISVTLQASPLLYFGLIMLIVFPHMILEALGYIMAAISGGTISKDVLVESFDGRRFNRVFTYNMMLFLFSLGALLLGVLVETYVLTHNSTYISLLRLLY